MRLRTARARVLLAALLVLLGLATLIGRLFIWPPTGPPGRVDAVLVLAGGHGERQDAGIRLVREGAAPVLVFSDGGRPGPFYDQLCRQRLTGIRVLCLTPRASTTRGEARAFAELAGREGWRSVAVVTSSYHARRAAMLVGRCYPGVVRAFPAPPVGVDGPQLIAFALHEGVAVAAALTVQRGC
jgi:uncharacterized SAM-binding protein YcdF (DUF218 family)